MQGTNQQNIGLLQPEQSRQNKQLLSTELAMVAIEEAISVKAGSLNLQNLFIRKFLSLSSLGPPVFPL